MKKIASLFFLLVIFAIPVSVSAQTRDVVREKIEARRAAMETAAPAQNARIADRCVKNRENIQNRSRNMISAAKNHQASLDGIVLRLGEYYQTHFIEAGYTLENYESLQNELQAKKRYTEMLTNEAASMLGELNCQGDPVAQTRQFKAKMYEVQSSLKEYRLAVRNMVVALKSNQNDQ